MSYTVSFDASMKLKVGNQHGLDRHNYRDLYQKDHGPSKHSNPNIHPERTKDNISYVYNHETGRMERAVTFKQIGDAIDWRIGQHKGNLRKNGVAVRDLILQLDPKWYENRKPEDWPRSYMALLGWARQTFGEENIVAATVHLDEGHGQGRNPHMHLTFIPMDEDGKLRQTKWINGRQSLGSLHTSLRNYLHEHKYDVSQERKKGADTLMRRRSEREIRELRAEQEQAEQQQQATDSARQQLEQDREDQERRKRETAAREARTKERERRSQAEQERLQDWRQRLQQWSELQEKQLEERQRQLDEEARKLDREKTLLDQREQETRRRREQAPPAHTSMMDTIVAGIRAVADVFAPDGGKLLRWKSVVTQPVAKALRTVANYLDKHRQDTYPRSVLISTRIQLEEQDRRRREQDEQREREIADIERQIAQQAAAVTESSQQDDSYGPSL